MRIIAVGIGGAGCRIVDRLYSTDRKSSKVACVQGLAIDVDEESMKLLTGLPENARMCFSTLEPGLFGFPGDDGKASAPIDINEIVSRIQNLESGENDAIFLCCGLGGGMADVAPHIIAGLRSSIVEPIFGLITLPCLAEGERISSKAADDIEMLSSLLDGIIVFDNETWYRKIKAEKARLPPRERGLAEKLGLKKSEKPLPPAQATYYLLNEAIVRRISLILRAGEFKADGGIDLAEVVLDSGEVLNTMKGMGFITIGYAVEKLPHDPLRFLSWLRPASLFDEDQKKKASRIVELAKQAIYHEISTPCDLTSAHKALVLVAGPSHELSMKGFMTVRKWIDRSIAGLETRSGDYPVMNTKNVAIIVMLSGLENIPRITELREIRTQSKPRKQAESVPEREAVPETDLKIIRDEMISLPARKPRDDEMSGTSRTQRVSEQPGTEVTGILPVKPETATAAETEEYPAARPAPILPVTVPDRKPEPEAVPDRESVSRADEHESLRRRVIVAHEEKVPARPQVIPPSGLRSHHPAHKPGVPDMGRFSERPSVHDGEEMPHSRETERQRIERELRRQRTVAIGGSPQKTTPHTEKMPHAVPEIRIIKRTPKKTTAETDSVQTTASPPVEKQRTVIIGKRKIATLSQEIPDLPDPLGTVAPREEFGKLSPATESRSVEIHDRILPAQDKIFEGRGVRKPPVPPARDSTLLHTELRPKKKVAGPEDTKIAESRENRGGKDPGTKKKRLTTEDPNQDLS
jgi:cell division GTPase FtsZ